MKLLKLIMIPLVLLTLVSCKPDDGSEELPTGEINTVYTDALKLTHDYTDKDFLTDGIGKATLSQNVDADTAFFKLSNGKTIKVRFLGINTPESTGRVDAWGKPASKYVADVLNSATEIVLEAEELHKAATLDTTGTRYLAYVWYKTAEADFRLINLEIIEQCYSQFTGNSSASSYGQQMDDAFKKSVKIARRIFGEKDPSFNYSLETLSLTISEILYDFDEYSNGTKLRVKARVVRMSGADLYLEDVEASLNEETGKYEKAGIYVYAGYNSGAIKRTVKIGAIIDFNCQATISDIYGKQLTSPNNIRLIDKKDGEDVEVFVLDDISLLKEHEGRVVKIENVKVNKKSMSASGDYTVDVEKNGIKFSLRIEGNPLVPFDSVTIGSNYDVIGGVSQFHDNYQIVIGNIEGFGINDFKKIN